MKDKVTCYEVQLARKKWAGLDVPEYFERDCWDNKNGFEACLIDAGVCDPLLDEDSNQLMLPPRGNPKATELSQPGRAGIAQHPALYHRRDASARFPMGRSTRRLRRSAPTSAIIGTCGPAISRH